MLLCLPGCAGGRSATAHDLAERPWIVATTEHFRVYSDLDGRKVEALAVDLERDVHLIAQAAFMVVDSAMEPTDVVVFSRDAHYHRYFPESSIGIAYRVPLLPERNHTVAGARDIDASLRTTLRHELVHDLFKRNFGAAPPWLSEGFAEYFSTVQLVEGQLQVGKAPPNRIAAPPQTIPTPSHLLRKSAQEFYLLEDERGRLRTAVNYFGAWAFVHFLMDEGGEYSSRFNRFLRQVRSTSVTQAWQEAFLGVEAEALDEAFRSYLWAGQLSVVTTPYRELSAEQAPEVRSLEAGEKHVLLAKLALAATRPVAEKEALFAEHVDAALRSGEPPPEAYYLRGVFAASRGEGADARRDFDRAVQLAPTEPRFLRASLAERLSKRDGRERSEVLTELRPEIEKLVALSTTPLELLLAALFFAESGEADRATILGSKAVSRAPVDPIVLSEYARVLEGCGYLESAVAMQRRALDFSSEHQESRKLFSDDLKRLEALVEQKKQPPAVP